MRNFSVKGVITGRGALIEICEVIFEGVRRTNSARNFAFCSGESPIASILTISCPTDILERSRRSSAKSENEIAEDQFFGAG
ncbi:Uncharacterised protein [marine metagenome]